MLDVTVTLRQKSDTDLNIHDVAGRHYEYSYIKKTGRLMSL